MEDIYTIKVRTTLNPTSLYPSERRYSASTVLGLGVVHLVLGLTAFLLASLSLVAKNDQIITENQQIIDPLPSHLTENVIKLNNWKSEESDSNITDLDTFNSTDDNFNQNITAISDDSENYIPNLTLAPCIMSIGAFAAGITGLLAWRRWYIDHNITFFFMCSAISSLVSFICLILIIANLSKISNYSFNSYFVVDQARSDPKIGNDFERKHSNIKINLAINVVIASLLELIWSILSSKIALKGIRNNYPDDVVTGRGRNVEVNTIYKGNNLKCAMKLTPRPDIIAHYPKKGRIAKYFPKKEVNGDFLPKAESHREYQERVNRFLTSNLMDDHEK